MPGLFGFEKHEKEVDKIWLSKDPYKVNKKYMLKNGFGFGGVNNTILYENKLIHW